MSQEHSRAARQLLRSRSRRWTLSALTSSGAGSGAAWAASRLPRRPPHDRPRELLVRAFRGHRLAILAHYSPDGALDRGFVHLGESLRALGYNVLVVSTGPAALACLAEQSEHFAFGVVSRDNEGFDFQSWSRGIELARCRALAVDRLILTNGSMFGPLGPMDHVLSTMDRHGTWGMTESMDFRRHIQSWWLGFGPAVLTHPEFDRYWARVRPASNKWGTILAHELTWSRDLALAGQSIPYVRVEDHGSRRNPLFFRWKELIRDWGMPFLKRSLFGPNYDRIDMTDWQEYLTDVAPGFDRSMVADSIGVRDER